jgi:hypothetical protein
MLDERFAVLADSIPGFGGFFFESGTLVVNMRGAAKMSALRSRIADFMVAGLRGRGNARAIADGRVATMRVRPTKYDYRELLTWERSIMALADGGSQPTMFDIDEAHNRIVVGVRETSFIGPMRASIAKLNVPPDAVEVIARSPSRPTNGGPSLQSAWSPIPDGVGIEVFAPNDVHGKSCTLGFNLTGGGTDRFFVTNSHCTSQRSNVAADADKAYQPGYAPGGGNDFATEVVDPDWITHDDNPSCNEAWICRFSDASLFKYNNPAGADHGHLAVPGDFGATDVTSFWRIEGWDVPYVGMPIYRIGKRTGKHQGTVEQSCINLQSAPVQNPPIWYLCQGVMSAAPSDTGDSGGPVVTWLGGDVARAIGIHWSADGAFSPFYSLQNEFYAQTTQYGLMDPSTTDPTLPPPIYVGVDGLGTIKRAGNYTWTCSATGGTGTFSNYSWERSDNGGSSYYPVGSNSTTYSTSFGSGTNEPMRLRCTVTSGSDTGTGVKPIAILIPPF